MTRQRRRQPFPEQVVNHLANCLRDAREIGGREVDAYFALVLGWFSHVVSDALFKGVYPNAVRVNFFGNQYHMSMLPAAETLTLTDLAHDFGVNWPLWHKELLRNQSDGGALRHLAMGDAPDKYDRTYWTEEFGKPDERIGRVLDALPKINRRWFHAMYTQPDYSAATPRLDKVAFRDRASARFRDLDLGEVRRYAIGSGWYGAFIKGVEIYMRVINLATERAELKIAPAKVVKESNLPSFSMWRRVIEEARPNGAEWGSVLRVEDDVAPWIANWRGKRLRIALGNQPTDYQIELGKIVRKKFRTVRGKSASGLIVIGAPQYNSASCPPLCVEESLRLKYEGGLAAYVRAEENMLLLCAFSDFGDAKLLEWSQGL